MSLTLADLKKKYPSLPSLKEMAAYDADIEKVYAVGGEKVTLYAPTHTQTTVEVENAYLKRLEAHYVAAGFSVEFVGAGYVGREEYAAGYITVSWP